VKNKVILAVILTISAAFSTVCAVSDAKQYKDKKWKTDCYETLDAVSRCSAVAGPGHVAVRSR
jgi:hypothetical protein